MIDEDKDCYDGNENEDIAYDNSTLNAVAFLETINKKGLDKCTGKYF